MESLADASISADELGNFPGNLELATPRPGPRHTSRRQPPKTVPDDVACDSIFQGDVGLPGSPVDSPMPALLRQQRHAVIQAAPADRASRADAVETAHRPATHQVQDG